MIQNNNEIKRICEKKWRKKVESIRNVKASNYWQYKIIECGMYLMWSFHPIYEKICQRVSEPVMKMINFDLLIAFFLMWKKKEKFTCVWHTYVRSYVDVLFPTKKDKQIARNSSMSKIFCDYFFINIVEKLYIWDFFHIFSLILEN